MAIAQRMRQPLRPPVLILIGMVALVLGVAALMFTWINASSLPTAGYSQFLSDVEAGHVTQVVQRGTTLEISGARGSYQVTLPNLVTDVYRDVEAAAAGSGTAVPLFAAQPAPDTSWLELVLTAVLPLGLLILAVAFVVLFVVRPKRAAGARSLTGRLRELDEAHRAGLIMDEERARQRSRILDEA